MLHAWTAPARFGLFNTTLRHPRLGQPHDGYVKPMAKLAKVKIHENAFQGYKIKIPNTQHIHILIKTLDM